ncbi:MAG TPA: hydrogenase small subunit, partial [Bryobacteraceae bacterium]|nr:hydrogenase small subunit [Bryobacteraceae bacterium]
AVPGLKNLINMSACPMNAENITALIVYYMTMKQWPPLDRYRRPLFAYGKLIHDNCERRAHFDAGQYVEAWGDEAHRQGACLYKMGCKGPATSQNCPEVRWNEGTNWPIGCGHPCVGCAEPNFWDTMTPFYRRLPDVPGFKVGANLDKIGLGAAAIVGVAAAAHGAGEFVRHHTGSKPEGSDSGSKDAEDGPRRR